VIYAGGYYTRNGAIVRAKMIWFKIALTLIGLGTILVVTHVFAQPGAVMLGVGLLMVP